MGYRSGRFAKIESILYMQPQHDDSTSVSVATKDRRKY